MEIVPGVHHIPGVTANPFLIVESDGLTLIDAGIDPQAGKILSHIDSLGHLIADLRNILITHADADHVRGLARLKELSGAEVSAGPQEAEAIEAGRMSRPLKLSGLRGWLFGLISRFFRPEAVPVDHTLEVGSDLRILGGLRVLATPGHTPGHLSFYATEMGVLFAGDSLRSEGGVLVPSTGMNTWDEAAALESARAQAALGARVVCVGHGPVLQAPDVNFELP